MRDNVKVYDAAGNYLEVHAVDAVEIVKNGGHYAEESAIKVKTITEIASELETISNRAMGAMKAANSAMSKANTTQAEIDEIKANQSDVSKLPSVQDLLAGYDTVIGNLGQTINNCPQWVNTEW